MLPYLHRLSAWLFYLIAGTFFVAYLLHYNGIGGDIGQWWLKTVDLPLALVAALYGGTSLYLSVRPKDSESKGMMVVIVVPLFLVLLSLVVLNFWPLIVEVRG